VKTFKAENAAYFVWDREDLQPFMYQLCNAIFGQGEKQYNAAIVYCNEFEMKPTHRNYERVMDLLDIYEFRMLKPLAEAQKMLDEMTAEFFAEEIKETKEPQLKIARICGFCGDGYVAEKKGHDCNV